MEVVLFSRRPRRAQNFSIELIAEGLLAHLGGDIHGRLAVSRFESNGLLRRAFNIVEASLRQGDVNHVMGDVHFLTYLLDPRKTVLTIHDCGSISGSPTLRKRLVRQLWFRIPSRRCAIIAVVSNEAKEQLLQHVDVAPDKIRVVPSFVPSIYRRFDKPFNRDCPVVLQVGTAPNKNLGRLCEALRGVRCKLWVTGELSPSQRSKLAVCQIDYENFVGLSTERMVELYVGCDVVAFVSTFEGFGMPIVEAQLVGRPVLTSTVASMPEVAGGAACLVHPFDVQAIRAGVQRIVADEAYRRQLVERGFENACRFDAQAVADAYIGIYRQLAAGRAGTRVMGTPADGVRTQPMRNAPAG